MRDVCVKIAVKLLHLFHTRILYRRITRFVSIWMLTVCRRNKCMTVEVRMHIDPKAQKVFLKIISAYRDLQGPLSQPIRPPLDS